MNYVIKLSLNQFIADSEEEIWGKLDTIIDLHDSPVSGEMFVMLNHVIANKAAIYAFEVIKLSGTGSINFYVSRATLFLTLW